jgi:UDP-glucose 4-epimerase
MPFVSSEEESSSGSRSPITETQFENGPQYTASSSSSSLSSLEEDKTADFILVVGGLGYIGSHTSWELLKAGFNVLILDDKSNSYGAVFFNLERLLIQRYPDDNTRPSLRLVVGDYRDKDLVKSMLEDYEIEAGETPMSRINGVIHFAAFKAVAESFQKPLSYYSNNVGGLISFCFLLEEYNIRNLVFSSSATVYGTMADERSQLHEVDCDNSSCQGLTNPYGRTKWMCEAILCDLAASAPEWNITALRYFNPIGCDSSGLLRENPKNAPSNLLPVVVNVMRGKTPVLDVFGTDWDTPDGTAIRDFIHVSDLALGHIAAIRASKRLGHGYKVFNLGTGIGNSVKEIVEAMKAASGLDIPTNPTSRRQGDVAMCIANPAKSFEMLGWKTEKSLDQCCLDILRAISLDEKCGSEA